MNLAIDAAGMKTAIARIEGEEMARIEFLVMPGPAATETGKA